MAKPRPPRGLFMNILNNLIDSLKPRQFRGTLIGSDHLGNKYYEITGPNQRKTSRYFYPPSGEQGFDQELPAEWEAWLRGRRSLPPTQEEIQQNLAIIQMKQINAAKIEQKFTKTPQGPKLTQPKGVESFPTYPDYEKSPGEEKH